MGSVCAMISTCGFRLWWDQPASHGTRRATYASNAIFALSALYHPTLSVLCRTCRWRLLLSTLSKSKIPT